MTDTTAGTGRWWETDGITFLNGVFEGGGAKGVAYGGALHAVCKADCWFSAVAGASAGAITAALVASGLKPEEITELTTVALEKTKLRGGFNGLRRLRRTSGYLETTKLRELLSKTLSEQYELLTGKPPGTSPISRLNQTTSVTFAELKEASGIELHVVAADLTAREQIVFNALNTPYCSVVDAVIASSSIPGVFKNADLVVDQAIHTIVDGGVWSNFPMFVFSESYRQFRTQQLSEPVKARLIELMSKSSVLPKEISAEQIVELLFANNEPTSEDNLVVGFLLDESQTAETDDSSLRYLTRNFYFADEYTLRTLKPAELTNNKTEPPTGTRIGRWLRAPFKWFAFFVLRAGPEMAAELSHGLYGEFKGRWPDPKSKMVRWFIEWIDDIAGTLFSTPILLIIWLLLVITLYFGQEEIYRLSEPWVAPSEDWMTLVRSGLTHILRVILTLLAVSVAILSFIGFAIVSVSLRAIHRVGYGLVRTYVDGTGAPPWVGFAHNEHVIRLPIGHDVSTMSFDMSCTQRTALQKDAYEATTNALGPILASQPSSDEGP